MASLLEKYAWRMHVVDNDQQAYAFMQREPVHVVIADIDAVDMGGLAVLACSHHLYPSMEVYAIVTADDGYRKKLARDLCGCRGFFYVTGGKLIVGSGQGIAAQITTPFSARMHTPPRMSARYPW